MKSAPRGTRRAGGHLDSTLDDRNMPAGNWETRRRGRVGDAPAECMLAGWWASGFRCRLPDRVAIVLVMLLLDLFNPRPGREAALLIRLDSDSDLDGRRQHSRKHYSFGRTHLRRAFCTFSKCFGGVWGGGLGGVGLGALGVREAALLHLDRDLDGQRQHGRRHYSFGRTHR